MRDRRLSLQRLRALASIEEYVEKYGACPTLQELADRLELSARSSAHRYAGELERQGLVTHEGRGEHTRAAPRTRRATGKGHRLLARWRELNSGGHLRGERELVLDASEWATAGEVGMPLRGVQVRAGGNAIVLRFRQRVDRDSWVAMFVGELVEVGGQ